MRRLLVIVILAGILGAGAFWELTRPDPLPADAMAGMTGDAERGERIFHATGCAACHMAEGAESEERLLLTGGQRFPSPFGTFVAPNISPDPAHGIGGWSARDLANAMVRGLSPEGRHYYPVFPYTSYARADLSDIADLHAFLQTLPASARANEAHDVGFPFNIRRGLGLWKMRYLSDDWVLAEATTPEVERGRYLAEALGHCGECHTPRDGFGGPDLSRWLAGAPSPSGKGRVPDLRPGEQDWTERQLVNYLNSGFTPDFDVVGGLMFEVVENLKQLPSEDHEALAAYLKAVPAAR